MMRFSGMGMVWDRVWERSGLGGGSVAGCDKRVSRSDGQMWWAWIRVRQGGHRS